MPRHQPAIESTTPILKAGNIPSDDLPRRRKRGIGLILIHFNSRSYALSCWWGRQTLPHAGRDTRPPPPRRHDGRRRMAARVLGKRADPATCSTPDPNHPLFPGGPVDRCDHIHGGPGLRAIDPWGPPFPDGGDEVLELAAVPFAVNGLRIPRSPAGKASSNSRLSRNRRAAILRRPSGAEEGEAVCHGRRGGGPASPAIKGTKIPSNSCSGS